MRLLCAFAAVLVSRIADTPHSLRNETIAKFVISGAQQFYRRRIAS